MAECAKSATDMVDPRKQQSVVLNAEIFHCVLAFERTQRLTVQPFNLTTTHLAGTCGTTGNTFFKQATAAVVEAVVVRTATVEAEAEAAEAVEAVEAAEAEEETGTGTGASAEAESQERKMRRERKERETRRITPLLA
jgi:hypothetical protein